MTKKLFNLVHFIFQLFFPDRKFQRALPEVFDRIDARLPEMIGHVTGQEVEELIARSINKTLGTKATAAQVQTVIELYSPIEAAIKAFRSMP